MSKMKGKQKVVSGFDLDAFVGEAEGKVGEAPHPKPPKPQAKRHVPTKPIKEQLTERIQFKITKSEYVKLQKEIGLVPVSKWLRHSLKEQGII